MNRILKRPLKNRNRMPKQYFVAKAVNGQLISGGRLIGSTGSANSQGVYLVVRSTAGLMALPTGSTVL